MKYFKKYDEVFAFEIDGSQDHLITSDFVEMTAEEIDRHLHTENYMTDAEKRAAYLASMPELTKRQFNLYLYDAGLKDEVDALLSANPRAKVEFDSTDKVVRTSPTVEAMVALLGLTDEQVDQMWEQALTL